MILAILLGCGTGLDGLGDEDALRIDALEPAWGPTGGGTGVTVTGAGFVGDVTVRFDGIPVDTVVEGSGALLITTPGWPLEAEIDVTVESDLGELTLDGAFTYTDGAPPDPDGSGRIVGLAEFSLLQVACPGCEGLASDLFVSAAAAFHAPVDGSWIGWMPPIGGCAVNPSSVAPASQTIDAGDWTYLISGSTNVPLQRQSGAMGPIYVGNGLDNADYVRNASYTVDPSSGTAIPNGLLSTEGFDAISPFELLYVNPAVAFSAVVRRTTGTTFGWSPTGSGNRFLVLIDAYSADGAVRLGGSMCVGQDTGSLHYPASALPWPANSLLLVTLARYRYSITPIPGTGDDFESVSWVGVKGTAILTN